LIVQEADKKENKMQDMKAVKLATTTSSTTTITTSQ